MGSLSGHAGRDGFPQTTMVNWFGCLLGWGVGGIEAAEACMLGQTGLHVAAAGSRIQAVPAG